MDIQDWEGVIKNLVIPFVSFRKSSSPWDYSKDLSLRAVSKGLHDVCGNFNLPISRNDAGYLLPILVYLIRHSAEVTHDFDRVEKLSMIPSYREAFNDMRSFEKEWFIPVYALNYEGLQGDPIRLVNILLHVGVPLMRLIMRIIGELIRKSSTENRERDLVLFKNVLDFLESRGLDLSDDETISEVFQPPITPKTMTNDHPGLTELDLTKTILDRGANVHAALETSVSWRRANQLIEFLVSRGADPRRPCTFRRTALHYASIRNIDPWQRYPCLHE